MKHICLSILITGSAVLQAQSPVESQTKTEQASDSKQLAKLTETQKAAMSRILPWETQKYSIANVLLLNEASFVICYNETPMQLPGRVAILCGGLDEAVGPHTAMYSRVFSNPIAEESMRRGKADYPFGSRVVKVKYSNREGTAVELMTVMIKREKGYNSEHGDWEYQVTDYRGESIARGKIDSCIKCHDSFAKTGYISRWFADAPKGGERDYSWDKVRFQDKGKAIK